MCEFNEKLCTPKCSKYPLCSFFEIERQIKDISEQLNLLFKATNNLSTVTINNEKSMQNLEEKLEIYVKDMLDLISEKKKEK